MQQMRLADADAAINKKGVVNRRRVLGDRARRFRRQVIRVVHNEPIKYHPRIDRARRRVSGAHKAPGFPRRCAGLARMPRHQFK